MTRRPLSSALLLIVLPLVPVGCRGPIDPQAEKRFAQALPTASVTVYPAVVRSASPQDHDPQAAERIAARLRTCGAAARTSDEHVIITGGWRTNQSAMWRQSAGAFQQHVRTHPIDTDYAVLAEYLIGARGEALGIHAYVVDAQGQLVGGLLLNSHNRLFAKAKPSTPDACTSVLLEAFAERYLPDAD